MKKNILKTISTVVLSTLLYSTAHAGAQIEVTLNNGDTFRWQFNTFEEAGEFLSDRVESGRCSPKVANVEIKSLWIDGIDDEEDKFAYFHGIENQRVY